MPPIPPFKPLASMEGGNMTRSELNAEVQRRAEQQRDTHKTPDMELIELTLRVELLERGEKIEDDIAK